MRAIVSAVDSAPGVTEQALREEFVKTQTFVREELRHLLRVFYWCNGVVIAMVVLFWLADESLLWLRPAAGARLVTEHVVMALIAASAAQLGALAFSVGSKVLRLQDTMLTQIKPQLRHN